MVYLQIMQIACICLHVIHYDTASPIHFHKGSLGAFGSSLSECLSSSKPFDCKWSALISRQISGQGLIRGQRSHRLQFSLDCKASSCFLSICFWQDKDNALFRRSQIFLLWPKDEHTALTVMKCILDHSGKHKPLGSNGCFLTMC